MKTITIRGIDGELDREIKARAHQSSLSVNQWILQALKTVTGLEKHPRFRQHHDLDRFAGSWSKEEVKEFRANTRIFEKIDEDIWK